MNHYDYARGLKATYLIQVIRSPKGKTLWMFAQLLNLAYLITLILGLMIVGFFWQKMPLPTIFNINFNFLCMLYFPNKIARWYVETELDGKTANIYVKDFLVYLNNYVIDQRPTIGFERVQETTEFSFRR
ncbi:conjugal transfer protein [Enterococcus durans]|uniref:Conjugal transfer protein n=1 Tax=Enterococcus durans TaxID=53345 RepID=A0A5N0YTC0_9ENTE|nr:MULTISPECIES: TcpE family conjugal transfer membrane protein [Enterococcus]KAA9178929.1 conjugal transfer protein [Enterococcus durans]KAA9185504.1 conjugal transfer protein [Enterococcus durans]KAA9186656.1 conjugal transfer protein [Enterococcus durans]KAA9191461.1 conjugal transfer protein [Enterococcus durans]KAA9193530.1 conjugal transfer protein [Enterococcus durans]